MTAAGLTESRNRTLVCSVVFIDLLDYSRTEGATSGVLTVLRHAFARPAVASLLAAIAIIGTALAARDYRETHTGRRDISNSAARPRLLTLNANAGERIRIGPQFE
jgi:hypothetical protein